MEVYMIHNKLNGKVYVGSTKYTKEQRFYGNSGNTHRISAL